MTADVLDVTTEALAELQKLYADDPSNYDLGRRVGELTNRMVAIKRARAPKPAPEPQAPYVRWSARQWDDALPAHCPLCEGRGDGRIDPPLQVRGYAVRYGEAGAQCLLCKGTYTLEAS